MITVTLTNISYDDDLRFIDAEGRWEIRIEGHALRGDAPLTGPEYNSRKGENIICAAVSHAALNLVRSLKIIGDLHPDTSIEDGLIDVKVAVDNRNRDTMEIARILVESFLIGMLDLEKKYRDFITIETVTGNNS